MLNETCMDCLAPLMKSKKGEKICFGCNKDYAAQPKIEETQAPAPQRQNMTEDLTRTKKMPSQPQAPVANHQYDNAEVS